MVRKGGPACPKCARNGAPGRTTIDIIYTSGTYLAQRTSNTLAILEPTTPLTATRAVWVVVRWSLGGGVASTRSEGDCSQRTACFRTAQATPSTRKKRHPQNAHWAGHKRQPNSATLPDAVEDGRRAMASSKNLVAGSGRSPKGLDKKPIWLELMMGVSGRS